MYVQNLSDGRTIRSEEPILVLHVDAQANAPVEMTYSVLIGAVEYRSASPMFVDR